MKCISRWEMFRVPESLDRNKFLRYNGDILTHSGNLCNCGKRRKSVITWFGELSAETWYLKVRADLLSGPIFIMWSKSFVELISKSTKNEVFTELRADQHPWYYLDWILQYRICVLFCVTTELEHLGSKIKLTVPILKQLVGCLVGTSRCEQL